MFGLGFWEIAVILVVALLVLGPSKLPELARGLGKGLREFRKATEDFKATVEEEAYRAEPPRPVAAPVAPALPPTSPVQEAIAAPIPAPVPAATAAPVAAAVEAAGKVEAQAQAEHAAGDGGKVS